MEKANTPSSLKWVGSSFQSSIVWEISSVFLYLSLCVVCVNFVQVLSCTAKTDKKSRASGAMPKQNRPSASVIHVLSYNLSYIPGVMKTGSANLKVVWYPTIWWFSWKIQFLDNTRFKTFEHLSKTFWNDFAKFSSRWVWNLSKVHSGISFFCIATAIATAVYQ